MGGVCPLCGKSLFYRKPKGRQQKAYELAHIYPLNPRLEEVTELDGVEVLSNDVNDPDNLIPLCKSCHGKFDKPRSRAEYCELLELKKSLIRREKQKEIQASYEVEADIRRVIDALYRDQTTGFSVDLAFDIKRLNEKLDDSMLQPTKRKVHHHVSDYYSLIRNQFLAIERENPTATELIYSQIKTFYLKQKSLGLSQQEIFVAISNWISAKAKPQSDDAAEIVTAFFIQNCEVFE